MKTKLTLSVDAYLVSKAKDYVMNHGMSLSKAVEDFFKTLTLKRRKFKEIEISPIAKSLRGSLKMSVGKDFDYKKELEKVLTEKYMK